MNDAGVVFPAAQLQRLIDQLRGDGYDVIGPTVRDHVIVYDQIEGVADLPAGWTDKQEAGRYQITQTSSGWFGFNVGPNSARQFLFPDRVRLWRASSNGGEVRLIEEDALPRPVAIIGLRSCDLHAIAIQDKVFLGQLHRDTDYESRRSGALLIGVQCAQAAATCFCDSMSTGPAITTGFDLALTELTGDGEHRFVARAGSAAGAALLGHLASAVVSADQQMLADQVTQRARDSMQRQLDTNGLKVALQDNPDHPHWDDIASRCLMCANCTMVCPTCFCSRVQDANDLASGDAERWRLSDSCFTAEHSYVHGGSVRQSGKSRYRQWLTHKLANWIDQFGSSGCVGCGRCITWCPVGIDITVEVPRLVRDTAGKPPAPDDAANPAATEEQS